MKVQRAELSAHEYVWLVIDDDYLPIRPITQFIRYLYNIDRSPNTIRAYANHLKLYWDYLCQLNKSWDKVQLSDFAHFISWLRKDAGKVIYLQGQPAKRTEATINAILTAASSFYAFHHNLGHTSISLTQLTESPYRRYKPLLHQITKNKTSKARIIKIKQPKYLPKTLRLDQVKSLLNACLNLRDQFLISLLYETGMRIGQILGLHHEDIKSWDNEIYLAHRNNNENNSRNKSASTQVIHVTAELMQLYSCYVLEQCQSTTTKFVFISCVDPQKPMSYSAVRDLFLRLSAKVKFKVTPHMFRHTHATELLRSGWDSSFVQRRLGHASVQTTINTYAHLNDDDLKKAFHTFHKTKGE